jgi:hypothetical protein
VPDLERDLRAARPDWPEPSAAATARARAALGVPASPRRSPRAWLAGGRGARLLIPAALLLTAGAAVAATIIGGGSSTAVASRPAALDFGPPEIVGRPVSSIGGGPSVAVDGRGVTTVAWARAGRVVVSSRSRGGGWSRPERLSDPIRRAAFPRVGADRAGNLTVTWRERTAAERIVRDFLLPSGAPGGRLERLTGQRWAVVARSRRAGDAWGDPVWLSPDTASPRDMDEPALAVSPRGVVLVAWDAGGVAWSRIRPSGGDWGPTVRVGSDAGEAVDLRLAAAPSGAAILTWANRLDTGRDRRYAIRAAIADPSGDWDDPALVDATAVNPPNAAGAVNDRGQAVVSWISESHTATATSAAVRSAEGRWSPPTLVWTEPGAFGLRGSPAMDADGRAIVLSGPRGVAMTRIAGGAWVPLALSRLPGRAWGLTATTDAAGGALLVRGASDGREYVIERPGGPVTVVPAGGTPSVAAGPDGTTALAWVSAGTASSVLVAVAEGSR